MQLTIEQALQQAVVAHNGGNLNEAERIYRAILQSQPKNSRANHNLGVIAVSLNRIEPLGVGFANKRECLLSE